MRGLIGLLAVLVVGGLAWLVFAAGPEPARAAALPEVIEKAEEQEPEPADLVDSNSNATASTIAVAEAPTREALKLAATPVASSHVTVRGTVVLIDAQEGRHPRRSGSLRAVEFGDSQGVHEVPIEGGRFSFELLPTTRFRIEQVVLDGVECGLGESVANLTAVADAEFDLEVYERVRATLIVRDRKSGLDLAGLELWNHSDWSYFPSLEPSAPTDTLIEAANQASPVVLPVRDGKQTWWVRAEGYAWEVVEFDHRFGGERVVLLDPEAILVVQVENRAPGDHYFLSLTRGEFAGRRLSREVRALEAREVRVDGLKAGEARVLVKRAGEENESHIDSAGVDLIAGETTHLTLSLPREELPIAMPSEVTVSGTLELPKGTTAEPSLLMWKWIGEGATPKNNDLGAAFERIDPGGDLWSWKLDDLVPGLWQVRVTPFGFAQNYVVGPNGATDVAFRVPRLSEVRVRVLDKNTGEPLPEAAIQWYSKSGETDSYEGSANTTDDPGVLAITTAADRIRLEVSSDHYSDESRTVSVGASVREEVVELEPSALATLILKEGTTVVRAPILWWIGLEAERVEGDGYVNTSNFAGDASVTLGVTEPGLYVLKFGELDGYLPIEPLEVFFEVGELHVEIQLVRE